MNIIGSWEAYATQGMLGETRVKPVKCGDVADIHLFDNGTGYLERRGLFGRKRENFTWQGVPGEPGQWNLYWKVRGEIRNFAFLAATDSGILAMVYLSPEAIKGMANYYRRA